MRLAYPNLGFVGQHHQQKLILRLMCGRYVQTRLVLSSRPVHPVRPALHRNAPWRPIHPGLHCDAILRPVHPGLRPNATLHPVRLGLELVIFLASWYPDTL